MPGTSKTIILSGGGTAGHIYPALALASELLSRGHEVLFAGTPDGLEATLVPEAGISFKAFEASGFDRSHPLTLVSGVSKILKSTRQAKSWFREVHPDAVVGFGGYVSIPVSRAAEKMGIPVIVHEQNSVAGMANKYIAKGAQKVCLTYAEAASSLGIEDAGHLVVTGNPVRREVVEAKREDGRRYLGIPADAAVLLVFGGSRGAKHINEAIAGMRDALLEIDGLHIVHITGPRDNEDTLALLDLEQLAQENPSAASRYHVKPYEAEMGLAYAAADAVVSRAGATSLAEIAARAVPAIFIPYPYARGGHQALNAQAYAELGAAMVIDDSELDSAVFTDAVMKLLSDAELRSRMHSAGEAQGARDAAKVLADEVEACTD